MDYEKDNLLSETRDNWRIGYAKKLLAFGVSEECRSALEKEFPELKEGEDEMIRKRIRLCLDECVHSDIIRDYERDECFAYLEKQKDEAKRQYDLGEQAGREEIMTEFEKEQKPTEGDNETEIQKAFREGKSAGRKEVFDHPEEYGLQQKQQPVEWSEEDEKMLDNTLDSLRRYQLSMPNFQVELQMRWLKSLRPQPKAEWSEDYREEDIQTRFAFYTYKDDPSVLYLSNVFVEEASRNHGFGTRILKAAEKVAEAIGAITICLKVKQDSPANAWYRKRGYGYFTFEGEYDWLEKKLEYLKPKQEQQEVDLEKEAIKFVQSKEFIESKESPVLLTARHFYELGLKARKEE